MIDGKVNYKGYVIKPKRDFGQYGFLIKGKRVRKGFVVIDKRNVNVMPAAAWFQTIKDAKEGIDILIKYGEKDFWKGYKAIKKEKEVLKKEVPEKEYWIVGYYPNQKKWAIVLRTTVKAFAEQEYKRLKAGKTKAYYKAIDHRLIRLG